MSDDLKAFPPAEAGMRRFVIRLPPLDDEDAAKVELQVGKVVGVDARNRQGFAGKIERETIVGWGFDRYVVRAVGPMAGTRMAADPALPKADRFVTLGGEPQLVRYNSKLPIVVYVPQDFELRYRLWTAGAVVAQAEAG